MAFKITAREIELIKQRRFARAQNDEKYGSLLRGLRTSVNMLSDSLRDLEDYMIAKPALKDALETDFDKAEKMVFDAKGLIKKMERLKVVVKNSEETVSSTRIKSLKKAHQACLEVIASLDDTKDSIGSKEVLEDNLREYNDMTLEGMLDKANTMLSEGKTAFVRLERAIESRK